MDTTRTYHQVDVETITDMPCHMAMEGPNTRIIRLVLDDDICRFVGISLFNYLHISHLGVGRAGDSAVPVSFSLCKNPKIVSVEMHGMGERDKVANVESDRFVLAKVEDVPLGVIWVRCISLFCQEKHGMAVSRSCQKYQYQRVGTENILVIGSKRNIVSKPHHSARGIGTKCDVDILKSSDLCRRCFWKKGSVSSSESSTQPCEEML